jgi:low temperature requirement protein LtrA
MIGEFLAIGAGALLLCSPMWLAWIFTYWLDHRPTPEQRAAHTREIVQRRRDQITRRGW